MKDIPLRMEDGVVEWKGPSQMEIGAAPVVPGTRIENGISEGILDSVLSKARNEMQCSIPVSLHPIERRAMKVEPEMPEALSVALIHSGDEVQRVV